MDEDKFTDDELEGIAKHWESLIDVYPQLREACLRAAKTIRDEIRKPARVVVKA
jgi:hypothetical protein